MSNFLVEEFYSMEYGPALEDTKEVEGWLDAHQRSLRTTLMGDGRSLLPANTLLLPILLRARKLQRLRKAIQSM